ncbi:HpcH/HpaI aldolase/citrate lyase family protein [Pontivivens nitratireducens]|uniref:CoA ester lyase n=1 Tax=Pontivivens nitratireducens TaxID=2758038 RepID=A0A6G7VPU1_9RHOB|nr:CoA ester lyase [Pontibrevibacter nitratireducens]QIK41878.1 CoA ester lyase [Pontibrevibacter nitratireducens]
MNHRPRRSVLYMPGSKSRALDKAATLPADALILDLEDAVSPAEKSAARDLVCEAVKSRPFGPREVIVRINGAQTEWGEADLAAAAEARPDAILLPKVESPDDIAKARAVAGDIAIWAMMETPRGLLNADAIAAAPGLACMVMGTNDLAKELHASHILGRTPMIASLGLALLAARAHGLAIIDGVYNAFKDDEGLRVECEQGRDMGFDGKTLIHPAQLAVTNEVFGPSPDALEEARAQIAAFEQTEASGGGVAVVNGRIVENLHVENARRLLAEADAIATLEEAAR